MKFSIKDAFKKAWTITTEHIWILLGLTSILGLISWILQMWFKGVENHRDSIDIGLGFVSLYVLTFLINILAQIGYTKILIKIYDGEEVNPKDIFMYYDRAWKFVVGSILYGLIVTGGLILLIVPGIIWAIKYRYFSYFIIDKNMKPVAALRESAKITAGNKWKLLGFGLIIVVLNLLGLIFFGIGFLITMPLTTLASVHVYKFLSGNTVTQDILPLGEASING